ncbi:hypothetical protein KKE60_06005 [Patescibacteria group bacterium]|nr:hypothetical protein [Patescibacteria group bacterium]
MVFRKGFNERGKIMFSFRKKADLIGKEITVSIYTNMWYMTKPFFEFRCIIQKFDRKKGFVCTASEDIPEPYIPSATFIYKGAGCICGNQDALRRFEKMMIRGHVILRKFGQYNEFDYDADFPANCPFKEQEKRMKLRKLKGIIDKCIKNAEKLDVNIEIVCEDEEYVIDEVGQFGVVPDVVLKIRKLKQGEEN